MAVMEHLFRSRWPSPQRVPFAAGDLKAFLATPMASAVAAQFLVSREAIHRWPLSFWQELQALVNGSRAVSGCAASSSLGWSEVASALERLWHTFFRPDNGSSSAPLYTPDVAQQKEVPQYLQVTGG
jgi:hypothetical protein